MTKRTKALPALAAALALAAAAAACGGGQSSSPATGAAPAEHAATGGQMGTMGAMTGTTSPAQPATSSSKAVELRIALNRLLGEHALLAIQAMQRGLVGGADFPALAKQLDRNSVALSQAIGSIYGPAAGRTFLNGKNLWRAHIKDFVAYTAAVAAHNRAGQRKALAQLRAYVQTQAAFFAKATGLPKATLAAGLAAHVRQLKGQLDAYARGDYSRAYALAREAYAHMGMTADALAQAIAAQQHLGQTSSPAADLEVSLDRLLGEHALLATWATQAGFDGDKGFRALAKALDENSIAIADAIGSLYGQAAADRFLNGKDLWRDHIRFFVDYTVAKAKHDAAGQRRAVSNLMRYVQTQAAFFADAIGLPKEALVNDLTAHVLQLKGALDAFAKGRYAQAFTLVDGAYEHMFMTGNALAAGIAKQKGLA